VSISTPAGHYFKKSNGVYEIIENLYPDQHYIEFFARRPRDRWTCEGAEIGR